MLARFFQNAKTQLLEKPRMVLASTVFGAVNAGAIGFALGCSIEKYEVCYAVSEYIFDHAANFNCNATGSYCKGNSFALNCNYPSNGTQLVNDAKASSPSFSWGPGIIAGVVFGVLGGLAGFVFGVHLGANRNRDCFSKGTIEERARLTDNSASIIASGVTGSPVYGSATTHNDITHIQESELTTPLARTSI